MPIFQQGDRLQHQRKRRRLNVPRGLFRHPRLFRQHTVSGSHVGIFRFARTVEALGVRDRVERLPRRMFRDESAHVELAEVVVFVAMDFRR